MALNTCPLYSDKIPNLYFLLENFRYVYLTVDILSISTLMSNKCPKFNMPKMKLLN